MPELVVARTEDLAPERLRSARELMYAAFDDMTEHDWDHALGGVHALVCEGPDVVAHASLVNRTFVHQGRSLRVGYVEAVAVVADRRRQGLGGQVMAPLEEVIRGADFDLGALGTTDDGAPFYASRGWQVWRGPLGCRSESGTTPTPEERGGVLVLVEGEAVDLDGELLCDWRPGDVW